MRIGGVTASVLEVTTVANRIGEINRITGFVQVGRFTAKAWPKG